MNPVMGRGNASRCWILVIAYFLAAAASLSSGAEVYNVGDEAGWIVSSNYSAWASSKVFHVGDTIVFIYNKTVHNVLEVNMAGYRSCNSASPIATHNSGNDSIAITSHGHRFFICGFPGHCAGGQKLDIRVPNDITGAPPPSDPVAPSAGSPSPNGRNSTASAPASAAGAMTVTGAVIAAAVASLAALTAALFG